MTRSIAEWVAPEKTMIRSITEWVKILEPMTAESAATLILIEVAANRLLAKADPRYDGFIADNPVGRTLLANALTAWAMLAKGDKP